MSLEIPLNPTFNTKDGNENKLNNNEQSAEEILIELKNPDFKDKKYNQNDLIKIIDASKLKDLPRQKGNLNRFGILNNQIAQKLIQSDWSNLIAFNLESFENLGQEIAIKILDDEPYLALDIVLNLDKFKNLNKREIAIKILDQGKDPSVILDNLNKFEDLDHSEVIDKLINNKGEYYISEYFHIFKNIDYIETANKLLDANMGKLIIERIDFFTKLDIQTFKKLINFDQNVINYIDEFENINQNEIINFLLDNNYYTSLIKNLEKFKNADHNYIANFLLDNKRPEVIFKYFDKFVNIDHNMIAQKLLDSKQIHMLYINLDKLKNLNKDILDRVNSFYNDPIVFKKNRTKDDRKVIIRNKISKFLDKKFYSEWRDAAKRAIQEVMPEKKYEAFARVAELIAKKYNFTITKNNIDFSTNRMGGQSWYLDCPEYIIKITDHQNYTVQDEDKHGRPIRFVFQVDENTNNIYILDVYKNSDARMDDPREYKKISIDDFEIEVSKLKK